jgi:hypothetical protein
MARQPTYEDVKPVVDLITDDEMWEAKVFIDETAHDFAVAKAAFNLAVDKVKMAEAAGVMLSKETNATRQQADARITPTYVRAIEAKGAAETRYEELLVKRRAAELKIEVWRTIAANKRAARQ